jgi:hypothetical protein
MEMEMKMKMKRNEFKLERMERAKKRKWKWLCNVSRLYCTVLYCMRCDRHCGNRARVLCPHRTSTIKVYGVLESALSFIVVIIIIIIIIIRALSHVDASA